MAVLIVSDGSIGKDISRWETPEEWRRDFDRALIRRRTRLSLGWRSRKQFARRQETPAPPDSSESQGGDTEPKEVTTLTLYHSITRAFRSSRLARTGLTLGGALALVLAISAFTAGPAQAASFRFQRGYSVQHGWLCYGWPNGALHCTSHWRRTASGALVSYNPSLGAQCARLLGRRRRWRLQPVRWPRSSGGSAPAGVSQWAISAWLPYLGDG